MILVNEVVCYMFELKYVVVKCFKFGDFYVLVVDKVVFVVFILEIIFEIILIFLGVDLENGICSYLLIFDKVFFFLFVNYVIMVKGMGLVYIVLVYGMEDYGVVF